MRTRYRLTGLLGSAAAVDHVLAGTALAQSMRPGLNLMNDKPPPSKEDDAYRSAIEKLPEKKKSADPWEDVSDQPHRAKVNNRRQQRCSMRQAANTPA